MYGLKGKGEVHSRNCHESPAAEQSYRFTLSLTLALDGRGWSTPGSGRFTSVNDRVPIV